MSLCVGLMPNMVRANEEILTIKAGQKAPYTGNLMPVSTFSQMMADAEMKDAIQEQLHVCQSDKAACVTAQDSDSTKWFGAGFVIGLVAVATIHAASKQ